MKGMASIATRPIRRFGLLLIIWMTGTLAIQASGPSEFTRSEAEAAFDEANRLYETRQFSNAVEVYQRLLQSGGESAALHFNLGNAWFQLDQRGQAIAHYRRALALAPRDRDIAKSLAHARLTVTGIKAADASTTALSWIHRISLNEWTLLATSFFWATLLAAGGCLVAPAWRPRLQGLALGLGFGLALTGLGLATSLANRPGPDQAVVTAADAVVRYGPLDESQVHFQLPNGSEVDVIDRKADWVQIRDRAGRLGWCRQKTLLFLDAV